MPLWKELNPVTQVQVSESVRVWKDDKMGHTPEGREAIWYLNEVLKGNVELMTKGPSGVLQKAQMDDYNDELIEEYNQSHYPRSSDSSSAASSSSPPTNSKSESTERQIRSNSTSMRRIMEEDPVNQQALISHQSWKHRYPYDGTE
jgi:hypothetical protein